MKQLNFKWISNKHPTSPPTFCVFTTEEFPTYRLRITKLNNGEYMCTIAGKKICENVYTFDEADQLIHDGVMERLMSKQLKARRYLKMRSLMRYNNVFLG